MRLRRFKLLIHSRRATIASLSAATVLIITGTVTNEANSKLLLAGGVASGTIGAAAALQRADSLEREIKRQRQVAEKDVQIIKDRILDVEQKIKQSAREQLNSIEGVRAESLDHRKIIEQIISETRVQITQSITGIRKQLLTLEKAQEETCSKAEASASIAAANQANGTSPAAEAIEDAEREARSERLPAAMVQLLERHPLPELRALNSELAKNPGQVSERLAGFLAGHSGITLALQGPPGTGKTTVVSQVIAQLAKQGKRIAISSHSHAAINHLLKKTKTTCAEAGVSEGVVKCGNREEEEMDAAEIPVVLKPSQLPKAMVVAGGPTRVFSRKELADQFDLLVVDEAEQLSLANLLVIARCARSILLVGDHPGLSGQSCLHYLMQDHGGLPDDRGIFPILRFLA